VDRRELESSDTVAATPASVEETLPAPSTGPAAGGLPLRDPARYLRAGEIARGGMGRIVAAHDQELGRRVAIKEVLSAGPALELRFEREVRITSRLQHPGIIAVLDAGRWPDGGAFYTMQHVEGRPLRDVIAAAASLEERVALVPNVLAVAEALAYAHGQRVIHRDLKPSNILVGAFGETIVIDWGLAKDRREVDDPALAAAGAGAAGAGGSVTVLGHAIGTPAYMPPEQARGDDVDARADVYAIGAILYHVLARQPPYADDGSATEVVERVVAGPPTSLDVLCPEAPADLRAVVAKALARDAEARYPTAAELAADLRRFATGQLVGAHRYSAGQLVRRWLRRRRAPVAVAAAALVALGVVGAVAVQRIREQRDAASAERVVAEAHRAEVEALLDFMLDDLRDKLAPIGKLELLGLVADRADAYYATRPIDWTTPGAARRRAMAHVRVGEVRVAQGDLPGGLAAFRAALAIFARLGDRADLAGAHEKIGAILGQQGDLPDALAAFQDSAALRREVVAASPEVPAHRGNLASALGRVGNALAAQGDLSGALASYRESLALLEAVVAAGAPTPAQERNLAAGHNKIGDVLAAQQDLAGALAEYRAGLAIVERLAAAAPDDMRLQRDLGVAIDNVAGIRAAQGDLAGALGDYRAGLAIAERISAHDPENAEWRRDLSISQVAVADLLREQRDLAGARTLFRAAHAIRAELAAADPSDAQAQRELSIIVERIGGLDLLEGDLPAARAAFTASLELRERLAAQSPSHVEAQRDVYVARSKLAEVAIAGGDRAAARREYDAALAAARALAAAHPDVPDLAADVSELEAAVTALR
jgi:tetratricopeptide (TPR) repeat protein